MSNLVQQIKQRIKKDLERQRPEQPGRITRPMPWPDIPDSPKPRLATDMVRRKAYIACPIAGEVAQNLSNAAIYCRYAYDAGNYIPICPALLLLQFMDEDSEREQGMSMGFEIMKDCQTMLVFGDRISDGMKLEIDWWTIHKEYHPIEYLSSAKIQEFFND